ncbi:MAG TPA: hypothetical protein VMZ53_08705 [Kofleriaceae bacterium]|nr:hypothetical protein [Kofleriaceae bacterium]
MKRLLVTLLAACGGQATPPPAPSGPPAALQPTPAPDDVAVASVNGKPVWGSCVAAQASRGITKQDALNECIDFELLAQAAEARGLALDPDVKLETRTALVSQLVAKDFEDKYQKPSDFGGLWDSLYQRNKTRFDHGEYRGTAYARINVAKNATPADDASAKAIADEIAARLANERGLMPQHLVEIAEQVAGTRAKVAHEVVQPYSRHGLDPTYTDAMFAIPEVGRTTPHAVRTPWGWDVILLNEIVPEEHMTAEQVAQKLLPEVKRTFFSTWTNQIAQRIGAKIQVEQKNLPLLENL